VICFDNDWLIQEQLDWRHRHRLDIWQHRHLDQDKNVVIIVSLYQRSFSLLQSTLSRSWCGMVTCWFSRSNQITDCGASALASMLHILIDLEHLNLK
jgi:hypothetical protein